MTIQSLVAKAFILAASLASFAAYADDAPGGLPGGLPDANNVPEPGAWALIGLAAAVGAIVSRKRK